MHISAWPPSERTQPCRGRKSLITTNVMCACNHDMKFTYVHSGWEGSAHDSKVFEEAIKDPKHGFPWPSEGMRLHVADMLCFDLILNSVHIVVPS